MAVTFVAAGTPIDNNTGVAFNIVAPACNVDDILIVVMYALNNQVLSPPDGTWTSIVEINGGATRASLFWRRAVSGDSGAGFIFTKPVDDNLLNFGPMTAWRGCINTGSPIDTATPTTLLNAAADAVTYATFDPSGPCHVVAVGCYGNDLTTAGAISGTNPTFTNRIDIETATGTDASIFCYSGDSDGAATGARAHSTTSTADAASIGILFGLVAASTGQTVALGQPSETDTAQAITPVGGAVVKAFGQVAETDLAQTIAASGGAVTKTIGQASEIDTAQVITPVAVVAVPIGQAAEADTAQSITPVGGAVVKAIGQVTEADAAQTIVPVAVITVPIGQAAETDVAQTITAVGGAVTQAFGQATEADLAQALTTIGGAVVVAIGQTSETDAAQTFVPVGGTVLHPFGQAIEVDSAQPIAAITAQTVLLGQAIETDTAQSIIPAGGAVAVAFGQVTEADEAQAITGIGGAVIKVFGPAIEVDIAQTILPNGSAVSLLFGQATETDVPQAITPVGGAVSQLLGQPIEVDVAQTITPAFLFPVQFAGFRTFYGGVMKELCLVATADAPLGMGGAFFIQKGATTYAVYLVETTDLNASNIRIRMTTGTKSIRLKT